MLASRAAPGHGEAHLLKVIAIVGYHVHRVFLSIPLQVIAIAGSHLSFLNHPITLLSVKVLVQDEQE